MCKTYQVEHYLISSWSELTELLNPLPVSGIRVLELQSDRYTDTQWLQQLMLNSHQLDIADKSPKT